MQPYPRMRIGKLDQVKRRRCRNPDTEFFVELTVERLLDRLACLDLATWKFPPACLGLTLGPLGQQHCRIAVPLQDAHGHLDGSAGIRLFPGTELIGFAQVSPCLSCARSAPPAPGATEPRLPRPVPRKLPGHPTGAGTPLERKAECIAT